MALCELSNLAVFFSAVQVCLSSFPRFRDLAHSLYLPATLFSFESSTSPRRSSSPSPPSHISTSNLSSSITFSAILSTFRRFSAAKERSACQLRARCCF